MSDDTEAVRPRVNPFTIGEVGEMGSLRAIADFTCPRCGGHTRFHVHDEQDDGGFVCSHCGLRVEVEGARLSDYQRQLDGLNAGLGNFAADVRERLQAGAEHLVREHEKASLPAAEPDGDES